MLQVITGDRYYGPWNKKYAGGFKNAIDRGGFHHDREYDKTWYSKLYAPRADLKLLRRMRNVDQWSWHHYGGYGFFLAKSAITAPFQTAEFMFETPAKQVPIDFPQKKKRGVPSGAQSFAKRPKASERTAGTVSKSAQSTGTKNSMAVARWRKRIRKYRKGRKSSRRSRFSRGKKVSKRLRVSRRVKRGGKSKLSMAKIRKMVARMMAPPQVYQRDFHAVQYVPIDTKYYVDLDYKMNAVALGGDSVNNHWGYPFCGMGMFSATTGTDFENELMLRNASRTYEITNIGNSIAYIKIYKFKPKDNLTLPTINAYLQAITGDSTLYLNENTTRYFGDKINGHISASDFVYQDGILGDQVLKRECSRVFSIKPTKEIQLMPNQTVYYRQHRRKPYTYKPRAMINYLGFGDWNAGAGQVAPAELRYTAGTSQPGNAAYINATQASSFRGVTEYLVMSVTGQTARGTTGGAPALGTVLAAVAAPVSLSIHMIEKSCWTRRVYDMAVVEQGPTVENGSTEGVTTAYQFGEDNNAAVISV